MRFKKISMSFWPLLKINPREIKEIKGWETWGNVRLSSCPVCVCESTCTHVQVCVWRNGLGTWGNWEATHLRVYLWTFSHRNCNGQGVVVEWSIWKQHKRTARMKGWWKQLLSIHYFCTFPSNPMTEGIRIMENVFSQFWVFFFL